MGTHKQLGLFSSLLVVLHKLIARPYCQRQYLYNSLNMTKLNCHLPRAFTPNEYCDYFPVVVLCICSHLLQVEPTLNGVCKTLI